MALRSRVALDISTIIFFSNAQLVLGTFGGSISSGNKARSFIWDKTKTTIDSASLSIQASVDWLPCDYIVYFNGTQLYRKDFAVTDPGTDNKSIDVTTELANGNNIVSVTFERPLTGATLTYTVTLYVTWTGETPTELPDWIAWIQEQLKNPYVLAGVGLGAVGLIVLVAKKKDRGPQIIYAAPPYAMPQQATGYHRAHPRRR